MFSTASSFLAPLWIRSFLPIGALFFLSVSTFGQNNSLQELELIPVDTPNQMVPVFASYPEDAAIIISSPIPNLRFDSNVGIIADLSDPNSGEYRLVLSPFRQLVTAQANGYTQLRFSVPLNSPRQVLFYEIRPKEQNQNLIPVVLSLSPLDATVTIDNQPVDPMGVIRIESGEHIIRVEKQGYRTIENTILVDENSFRFDYQLDQIQPARVTIRSNPTNARLEINNVEQTNPTDWQDFLFPGEYFVRISIPGYKVMQANITVEEGVDNVFSYELEEYGGDLVLNVTPAHARITLNSNPLSLVNGRTKVIPGPYTLRIEADGYTPHSENIVISEDMETSRTINLQQIVGTLRLTIQPISANVIIRNSSGQIVQQWTGGNILPLPIGNYTLSATADNFEDYFESFAVRENQTSTLNPRMISFSEAQMVQIEQQRRADSIAAAQQRQLEIDRQNQALAREQAAREASDKERRQQIFKHPAMGGMYLNYSTFTPEAQAFQDNVESQYGIGMGFFKYKNYITTYFDFVYNAYALTPTAANNSNINDEIVSYNASIGLVPTLPVGPFMVGLGAGFDFSQYEGITTSGPDAYYYTYDMYTSVQLALKPKSWGVGFLVDMRKNIDIGLNEVYNPWSQLKFSFIWAYN